MLRSLIESHQLPEGEVGDEWCEPRCAAIYRGPRNGWRPPALSTPAATGDTSGRADASSGLDDVTARRRADHQPYVAHLDGNPVAYGWSAGKEAAFGPQRTAFTVPDRNRYLWGFVPLLPWRGRGIYPRLLQAIITHERAKAERIWILHRWDNTASARGIQKAGFSVVAQICFLPDGGFGLIRAGTADRADAGATVLGLPLIDVG